MAEFGAPPKPEGPPKPKSVNKLEALMNKKVANLPVWVWIAFLALAIGIGIYLRNRQNEPEDISDDDGVYDFGTLPASLGGPNPPDPLPTDDFPEVPDDIPAPLPEEPPERFIDIKAPKPGYCYKFRQDGRFRVAYQVPCRKGGKKKSSRKHRSPDLFPGHTKKWERRHPAAVRRRARRIGAPVPRWAKATPKPKPKWKPKPKPKAKSQFAKKQAYMPPWYK